MPHPERTGPRIGLLGSGLGQMINSSSDQRRRVGHAPKPSTSVPTFESQIVYFIRLFATRPSTRRGADILAEHPRQHPRRHPGRATVRALFDEP